MKGEALIGDMVTVHGVSVILSVAKNLSWNRGPDEILRYAQNDDVFRPVNDYSFGCITEE